MFEAWRRDREWRRSQDRTEREIRHARRHRRCYAHVLEGRGDEPATRGDLCEEHFASLTISHPG